MSLMTLVSLRKQIAELPIPDRIEVTESLTKVGQGFKSPFYDTKNKVIYALREEGEAALQGVVKSKNNGKTWEHVFKDPIISGEFHRNLFVTKDGTILLWGSGNRLLRVNSSGVATHTHSDMYAPLLTTNGIEQDPVTGIILYAEYANLSERIWKSTNDGVTWTVAHTDPDIRHWHGVQRDPYTGHWYAFAGDTSVQSRIKRSTDDGLTWTTLAQGDQRFRSCGMQFSEEYIFWSPDYASVGVSENTFLKIKREHLASDWLTHMEVVSDSILGPAYGIIRMRDGRFCFWTAAENREMSGIYVSDAENSHLKLTTNRTPNTGVTNAGFTQITHVDDENVAYVSTSACGYGNNQNLFVIKLPTMI